MNFSPNSETLTRRICTMYSYCIQEGSNTWFVVEKIACNTCFCNIFVCPLSYPIYIANFLRCFLCMSLLERGVLCCVTMSWMRNINRFTPLLNNILAQKLHENFKHNDLHPCLWRCVVLCKFVPEFLQNGRNSFNSESCIYLSIYLPFL